MKSDIIYRIPTPIMKEKDFDGFNLSEESWHIQELKVREVQKITKGKGASLCFIDDGVGNNIELQDLNIERWTYMTNAVYSGDHSTYGAVLVAGKSLGLFPEMGIVSKQALDPVSGAGGSREVVSAIYKAKEMGVRNLNMSLGSNYPDREIEKALKSFCDNGINTVTIAAGNDGPDSNSTDYPARYAQNIPGVFSIAALQVFMGKIVVAFFSSRGIITLAAPGHALKSMDQANRFDLISGTSFAAPIVGGTIAAARTLVKRELTQNEILDCLTKSSQNLKDSTSNVGSGGLNIVDFFKEIKKLKPTPTLTENKPTCWEKIKKIIR